MSDKHETKPESAPANNAKAGKPVPGAAPTKQSTAEKVEGSAAEGTVDPAERIPDASGKSA